MDRLILYGSGKRCKVLCKILQWGEVEILAILDSNPVRWGKKVGGNWVESPKKIEDYHDAAICITVSDISAVKEIRKNLHQMYGYDLKKEIGYYKIILEIYKKRYKITQKMQPHIHNFNKQDTIIFDCYNGLGLGGVETWTINLCEALLRKGDRAAYIISDNGVYHVPDAIKKNIINVDIDHYNQFSLNTIDKLVEVIIKKLPCKVITCTTNEVMLAACLVKRYCPDMIQIISVIHNSNEKVYKDYMDFRECSDIYIGVSQDIKNDMIYRGVEPEKIYSMTCPFFCERNLERVYTENYSMPIRIGYAGRMDGMLHSQKRMDLFLKTIEVLVEKNVCFDLEFAGDGPARHRMEETISANRWDDRVHFLGTLERSKMPNFWKEKDICLNLADYEGRSISIIEAMGSGAVPIVTSTSGVREDIKDNVNGYIISLGDYNAAATKIQYLEANRWRLRDLGKEAHDVVYPKSLMEPHIAFWEKILWKK